MQPSISENQQQEPLISNSLSNSCETEQRPRVTLEDDGKWGSFHFYPGDKGYDILMKMAHSSKEGSDIPLETAG